MKKLTLLFVLLSFFIVNRSFSQADSIELRFHPQLDTFNLSKYVLPELKYNSLNFSAIFNSDNSTSINYINKYEGLSSINSGIYISNYSYSNSPKLQKRSNTFFDLEGMFSSFEDKSFNEKGSSENLGIQLSIIDDYRFYNNSKIFLGLTVNSNVNFYIQKYDNLNNFSDSKILKLNLEVGFLYGYGRVEDVSDAWKTIRILKDFSRLNILRKTPGDIDIIDIANTIAEARSTRIFDSRLKRTSNLKEIDNKLKEKGLVSNMDMIYFTSLYDMWSFFTQPRNAGNIFSVGLYPMYNYGNNYETDKVLTDVYGLGFKLKYESYKPINTFWQFDIGYAINLDYVVSTESLFLAEEDKTIFIYPNVNASLSYFPTTRTAFNSSIDLNYYYPISIEDNNVDDSYIRVIWSNQVKYYLSPRMSLEANLHLLYNINDYQTFGFIDYLHNGYRISSKYFKEGLNYSTSLRFTYDIF